MRLAYLNVLFPLALLGCQADVPREGVFAEQVPICFHTPEGYDCEAQGTNQLQITPASAGEARIDLDLVFTNGHSCGLENAPGRWVDERLLVTVDSGADACEFSIAFDSAGAHLSDTASPPCREQICGARGMLDGISLPFQSGHKSN